MKKRKGMMLALVLIIVIVILFTGAIASNIALSTHQISYGNLEKSQSFYLAKAGLEMGKGFLLQPIEATGQNWFEIGNPTEAKTLNEIKNKLNAKTGGVSQKIEVYYDKTDKTSIPIFYNPFASGGSVPSGEHFGDIEIMVELNGGPKKEEAFYRITSTAEVFGKGDLNNKYNMVMEVRLTNQSDVKYY